jgi:hypothetical protein
MAVREGSPVVTSPPHHEAAGCQLFRVAIFQIEVFAFQTLADILSDLSCE